MSKKYSNYKRPSEDVHVEQKLLPEGIANRSGKKQIPQYIVIHEVSLGIGRSPQSFNLEYYANKILQDGLSGSTIGYHFLVGDKAIYQFVKEDEATNHTGTIEGNNNSIGVERLICEGVNYENALHNQAQLIATLMVKWNIPIENVVTHKMMQQIYEPVVRTYTLRCNTDNVSANLLEDINVEYRAVLDLYKGNIGLFTESQINDFKMVLDEIDLSSSNTLKNKIYQLYLLVDLETKIRAIIAKSNNQEYIPFEKEIGGIKFFQTIVPKNCPNRLNVGQRGGLDKFYREIEKCLQHEMFFEELFENKRGLN